MSHSPSLGGPVLSDAQRCSDRRTRLTGKQMCWFFPLSIPNSLALRRTCNKASPCLPTEMPVSLIGRPGGRLLLPSFIHLCSQHLLCTYYMPGARLDSSPHIDSSYAQRLYGLWKERHTHKNKDSKDFRCCDSACRVQWRKIIEEPVPLGAGEPEKLIAYWYLK